MNTDYAALALIVDRSGSMHSIASDVRGSVKQFIGDQQKHNGRASLTVAQFDHQYEVVYDFKDIKDVDAEKFANAYSPRGSTALLDAIGRTTIALQKKLDGMPLADRPKRVVVAIITDGYENASTEFKLEQIKEMIKKNEALGWDFMFMGASLDTIEIAKNMGFSADKSAAYNTSNAGSCFDFLSQKATQARQGQKVDITPEERTNLMQDGIPAA